MKRILIDCDPGIDDSIALILALKSPELHVEAITTVTGNLHADKAAENARKVLELIGRVNVPVSRGSLLPLTGNYPHDPFSHGQDGLGNTNLPASAIDLDPRPAYETIIQGVKKYPNEVTIVAIGPLTNIALAIMQFPDIVKLVKEFVMIGGSFGFNEFAYTNATGGNPVSEWNVFVDPEAARIVFNSGIKITAIGLDVATHPDINLQERHRESLMSSDQAEARYFLDLIEFVEDRNFQTYCVLIDSMAVAAAIDPKTIECMDIFVDVETKGELTRGQTVVDHRKNFQWKHLPKISAAYRADYEIFLNLLISRITL